MADGPFLLDEDEQDEINRRVWREQAAQWLAQHRQALRGGAALEPPAPNDGRIVQPVIRRPARASFFNGGNGGMYGLEGHYRMAQNMAGQQGGHLAGMANQINQAIQDENDSRVAQMRELRRQEHEKEMLRMQQEALLERLRLERELAERQSQAADRARGILYSSTWKR